MLTEIAWWGGLIFIWWAICYRLLIKEWDTPIDIHYIIMHATFISTAVVLALYFYSLESTAIKHVYVASLGIAIISTVLMFFLPESKQAQEVKANDAGETEDEENGAALELLSQAILITPLLVAVMLGLFKSYGIAKQLHWLG